MFSENKHKNIYKRESRVKIMKREGENTGFFNNKKAQITIFIIVAIIVVAIGVLVYLFYPQISGTLSGEEQNPNSFIQNCIKDNITNNIEIISTQGGSLNPEPYILYQDEKIQYLCYTGQYFEKCVVQKPFLKRQIEKEIKSGIENQVKSCFNELKKSFEGRGYDVAMREGSVQVELLPGWVVSTFNYSVTMTRTETERYESFNARVKNNIYELASIADSIVDLESEYGDADSALYMELYHNLKVEKRTPEYGTTIYILTDRDTKKKIQFASRSIVMPPGYGYSVIQ